MIQIKILKRTENDYINEVLKRLQEKNYSILDVKLGATNYIVYNYNNVVKGKGKKVPTQIVYKL